MKIAICDDELNFCNELSELINNFCSQHSIAEPVELCVMTKPAEILRDFALYDVIFMDIEMPEINGITVSEKILEICPEIILVFISNRDDMVFNALNIYPYGFIQKKNMYTQVSRVLDKIFSLNLPQNKKITFKTPKGEIVLKLGDVICFTSVNHSVYVITHNKANIKIKNTLGVLEKTLQPFGFACLN